MQIYEIYNPIQGTNNFVCDSQETIDAGKTAGYTGIFSIGTQVDADAILATNRQDWLTAQADLFCVNKNVVTSDGHLEWITVNLSTEPPNIDVIYKILNTPNGNWVEETGLDSANAEFAAVQQNYLAYSGLATYVSWTSWPVKPPVPPPPPTQDQ